MAPDLFPSIKLLLKCEYSYNIFKNFEKLYKKNVLFMLSYSV